MAAARKRSRTTLRELMLIWKSTPDATLLGALVISTAGVLSDTSPESTATQVLPFWKPSLTVSGLSPQSLDSGASPSPVAGSLGWLDSWALTAPRSPSRMPVTIAITASRRVEASDSRPRRAPRDGREGASWCGIPVTTFHQRARAGRRGDVPAVMGRYPCGAGAVVSGTAVVVVCAAVVVVAPPRPWNTNRRTQS